MIIVGTGPAGLFAALELSKSPKLEIIMFEKGGYRQKRTENNLISGIGGAGSFSDGKLTLPNPDYPKSMEVGGILASIVGFHSFLELVEEVDKTYSRFGGRSQSYENNSDKIKELVEKASVTGLQVIPTKVRHFGSDLSPRIIGNMVQELKKRGVQIHPNSPITSLRREKEGFSAQIGQENPKVFRSKFLIVAPGRGGSYWLAEQAEKLGAAVQPRSTQVDIGVRVEIPAHILQPVTDYLYDPKIIFYPEPFEDKIRTFCVCPYGEVIVEKYQGMLTTVNGHSLHEKRLSENTNFALLVSSNFTEPFKEPTKYAGRISELANMLAGKVLVQRLGNLRDGRRSKPEKIQRGLVNPTLVEATPGDLSYALPFRHLTAILRMLEALDKIVPGINGNDTLLYGNEVKFYSSRIKTTEDLEASDNFFVAGDGAGITRGLVQSSISGIIAAKAILEKI